MSRKIQETVCKKKISVAGKYLSKSLFCINLSDKYSKRRIPQKFRI